MARKVERGESIQVAERDNADVRRRDRRVRGFHTMYMAYTQSCAEHITHRLSRTRHLEMVLNGTQRYEKKPVHQQDTVVQPASDGGRRGMGFRDLKSRWTGSDGMQ